MTRELFVVVRFEGAVERIQHLEVTEATIGRLPTNAICLPHSAVSRKHAMLSRTRTAYHIRDLSSRNGTRLNGRTIEESPLPIPASIEIGPYQLTFVCDLESVRTEVGSDFESTWSQASSRIRRLEQQDREKQLTPAQSRVYAEFLRGHTEKEVANALNLSINTVHTHARAIYAKFDVTSRGELLALSVGRLTQHG